MLKKWISAPLYDVDRINDRLDAVEDLIKHPDMVHRFQEKMRAVRFNFIIL